MTTDKRKLTEQQVRVARLAGKIKDLIEGEGLFPRAGEREVEAVEVTGNWFFTTLKNAARLEERDIEEWRVK